MTDGPGRYNEEATALRQALGAEIIGLVVVRGNRGDGFSLQVEAAEGETAPALIRTAVMMRAVADQLDNDAMRHAGKDVRARARLVLEAATTSLAMLSYGLGAFTQTLVEHDPGAVQPVLDAVNAMTQASDALQRAIAVMKRKSRGAG